jgi:hypothetical protein
MNMTTTSRTRAFILAISIAGLGACSSKQDTAPPVTQRQRDSLLGASSLPGAKGVKGALAAQDSAARRKAVLDSIARADSGK